MRKLIFVDKFKLTLDRAITSIVINQLIKQRKRNIKYKYNINFKESFYTMFFSNKSIFSNIKVYLVI